MADIRLLSLSGMCRRLACGVGGGVILAVILASCRYVEPRDRVFAGVKCESRREPSCIRCLQAACCTQFLACVSDAPCPCWLAGRAMHAPTSKTLGICGAANASFTALAACMDAQCAAECPVEDPVLKHPLIGKPAPEIVAEPIGGEGPKTIAEARGKIVILDFWASWCHPCKASFPKYQEILDRFPNDVAVLAVSVDDPRGATKEKLLRFAKETGARFSILWDTQLRMEARYTMPEGLPTAFIIDRGGIVRSVHVGYDGAMLPRIEALVSAGRGGNAPPSPP